MKIGVIGFETSVDAFAEHCDSAHPMNELVLLKVESDRAGDVVREWEKKLDGILFTGYIPYLFACRDIPLPAIPWEYLSRDSNSLFEALLTASQRYKSDISRITYDAQEDMGGGHLKSILNNLYFDDRANLSVSCYDRHLFSEGSYSAFIDGVVRFHINNLRSHKADVCLTGISAVQRLVEKEGFVTVPVHPTAESSQQQLNRLLLRCRMRQISNIKDEQMSVVLIISIVRHGDVSGTEHSEFAVHRISSIALDSVYSFAQRTNSAVENHENSDCFIYSNGASIDLKKNYESIERLLLAVSSTGGVRRAYLGIGVAANTMQAKACAYKALKLASSQDSTCYCSITHDKNTENVIGPLKTQIDAKVVAAAQPGRIEEISRNTGLSAETIVKLGNAINNFGIDITTADELVRVSGIRKSNMYRILGKLEASGYLETVGRLPLNNAGRPQRLIRLNIGKL